MCACVCCKILAARITFHVCVCVWQRETLSPREYSRTQNRENSHSRTHKIESTAAAHHPWLGFCTMQNSNFYPVNMLKKSLITIMEGGVGDKSTIKIVLIQNASHFSDSESLKWIYI